MTSITVPETLITNSTDLSISASGQDISIGDSSNNVVIGQNTNSITIGSVGTIVTFGSGPLGNISGVSIISYETTATQGGTATAGSFLTYPLNTIVNYGSLNVTLSSSQLTVPAGNYFVTGYVKFVRINNGVVKLINTAGGALLLTGSCSYSTPANPYTDTTSIINGYITLGSSTVIELQYRVASTQATYGLGSLNVALITPNYPGKVTFFKLL